MEDAEIPYPPTASHLRARRRSDSQPDQSLRRLAVDSASPSTTPTAHVRTPSTFARKSGRTFCSISLETSVRKLVTLATQTLRCRCSDGGSRWGDGSGAWAQIPMAMPTAMDTAPRTTSPSQSGAVKRIHSSKRTPATPRMAMSAPLVGVIRSHSPAPYW